MEKTWRFYDELVGSWYWHIPTKANIIFETPSQFFQILKNLIIVCEDFFIPTIVTVFLTEIKESPDGKHIFGGTFEVKDLKPLKLEDKHGFSYETLEERIGNEINKISGMNHGIIITSIDIDGKTRIYDYDESKNIIETWHHPRFHDDPPPLFERTISSGIHIGFPTFFIFAISTHSTIWLTRVGQTGFWGNEELSVQNAPRLTNVLKTLEKQFGIDINHWDTEAAAGDQIYKYGFKI